MHHRIEVMIPPAIDEDLGARARVLETSKNMLLTLIVERYIGGDYGKAKPEARPFVVRSLRLPPATGEALRKKAKREGVSLSEAIRHAINGYVKGRG